MPRPVDPRSTYLPGLDGIRALAVGLVLAYHFDLPGASGGLLGVGVFFTLSGFLITGILLKSWARKGDLELKTFWLRRARRLIPAVLLVLGTVLLWELVLGKDTLGERAEQALAALLYVANWHTIANGDSYFDRFAGPSPLEHLWSLSVEEQFYVVWPLLLLLLLVVTKGRRKPVAIVTVVLAVVSFVLLFVLSGTGFDTTRAYEGTDTRAGGLLLGALLAYWWVPRGTQSWSPGRRAGAELLGLGGLAGVLALAFTTDQYSRSLYSWGILALSVATLALVVGATSHGTVVQKVMSIAPLRWVGERSYGIYLWHMPVAAATPENALADHVWLRSLLQTALTLVLAALSWKMIEDPIRKHGVIEAWRRSRAPLSGSSGPRLVPGLLVASLAFIVAGTGALAATAQLPEKNPAEEVAKPQEPRPSVIRPSSPTAGPGKPKGVRGKTSCEQLIHVGDSTSMGLTSTSMIPKASDRIPAQYKRVGVKDPVMDIAGARSSVERFKGEPNAEESTAKHKIADKGCWVFAMGTNDTANVFVGGAYSMDERVDLLMKHSKGKPAMWLTVKSISSKPPYTDVQMQKWNDALVRACKRYPNMRIYDWRTEMQNSWFVDDGIHFTTKGYIQRAKRIADALAVAFPQGAAPVNGCMVASR